VNVTVGASHGEPATVIPRFSLQEVLDRLQRAPEAPGGLTVERLIDAVGRRSFGTALLVPALILLSPISAIPGIPTAMGALVVLICAQLLLHKRTLWMPGWVLHRRLPKQRWPRALRFLRPIARGADWLLRPRLVWLVSGWRVDMIATICLLLALCTTPLELLPGANTTTGAALTAFALSLVARDGLLAIIGMLACAMLVTVVGWALF